MSVLAFGTVPSAPHTDERYTPAWVFRLLSEHFDLDPASPVNGGDCVPADRKLTVVDDGLTSQWGGAFVWLNPPFSNATPWARRFIAHGNGVWLGPVANAAWFNEMAWAADRLWLMRDFAFTHPTHAGKRSSMPLAIAAMGSRASAAVDRAGTAGGPGVGVVVARVAPPRKAKP